MMKSVDDKANRPKLQHFAEADPDLTHSLIRQPMPKPGMSQVVFLRWDGLGGVQLDRSAHIGHRRFKGSTEPNRGSFFSVCQDSHDDRCAPHRIAQSLLRTFASRDRGRIFMEDEKGGLKRWRRVVDDEEAINLVLRAVKTPCGVDMVQENVREARVQNHRLSTQRLPPKKRHVKENFDIDLPRKVSLSISTHTVAAQMKVSLHKTNKVHSYSRVDNNRKSISSDDDKHAKRTMGTGIIHVPSRTVEDHDIIVGRSGQGALSTTNSGNRRFHALIKSNLSLFAEGNKMKKLRIAQLIVTTLNESFPKTHFLTQNPSDGCWYEVSKEKAWSKTIRTFQAHLSKNYDGKSPNQQRRPGRQFKPP